MSEYPSASGKIALFDTCRIFAGRAALLVSLVCLQNDIPTTTVRLCTT